MESFAGQLEQKRASDDNGCQLMPNIGQVVDKDDDVGVV